MSKEDDFVTGPDFARFVAGSVFARRAIKLGEERDAGMWQRVALREWLVWTDPYRGWHDRFATTISVRQVLSLMAELGA